MRNCTIEVTWAHTGRVKHVIQSQEVPEKPAHCPRIRNSVLAPVFSLTIENNHEATEENNKLGILQVHFPSCVCVFVCKGLTAHG